MGKSREMRASRSPSELRGRSLELRGRSNLETWKIIENEGFVVTLGASWSLTIYTNIYKIGQISFKQGTDRNILSGGPR